METTKAGISIILPSCNRADKLIRLLEQLEKQIDKKTDRIIVIDDGSTNTQKKQTKNYCQGKKHIVLGFMNNSGPATARNWGLAQARGDIVLFLNDDMVIGDNFIEGHRQFHKKKSAKCGVIGKFETLPELVDSRLMKWLVEDSNLHFKYFVESGNRVPWWFFWTCNLSIKREFLDKNNLKFDQDFKTAAWEDVEFGYRAKKAGLRLYLSEELTSFHDHYFTYKSVMNRFYSHGKGLRVIENKLPSQHLPLLAKRQNRLLAVMILCLSLYPITKLVAERLVKIEKRPINWLMQYLIVGQKIKGYYGL